MRKMSKKIIFFAFYGSKIWRIARIIVPLHHSFENERSFGARYVMKHIEPCFYFISFNFCFSRFCICFSPYSLSR